MRASSPLLFLGALALLAGACSTDAVTAPENAAGAPASGDPPATNDPSSASSSGGVIAPDAGGGGDASPPAPPRPDDGIKNGSESGVDCGGPDAKIPRCPLYQGCLTKSDCDKGDCFLGASGAGRCQIARSCTGEPGTQTCGLDGHEDCCTSLPVPGGSFNRQGDVNQPTTVSGFTLDKFEITVGRVRAYFEAVGGNPKGKPPPPGGGLHPKVDASGWRSSFDVRLPASWHEIDDRLGVNGCAIGGDNSDGGGATWTPTRGACEEFPITCLDWYTLFAFCVWDGGRLPTDAEWDYAVSGGDEQRTFAWGNGAIYPLFTPENVALVATAFYDSAEDVYRYTVGTPFGLTDASGKQIDGPTHISPPGRKTGVGRWGHADLTGNMLEYLLDRGPIPPLPCNDCARVDWQDPPQDQIGFYPNDWTLHLADPKSEENFPDGRRSLRGGSWQGVHPLYSSQRYDYRIYASYSAAGGRCAR